jgi:hypothetical protein
MVFRMATFQGQTIAHQSVALDGNEYVNCQFESCQMMYMGGELPKLSQCHFTRCSWHLEDAAQRTVRFLRGIYHSGPGGRELVEDTLKHIRVRI